MLTILIVRVSSLGDIVHNMPMVADILRHYPDAKIDWVVEEAYVDLVRLHPGVRYVIGLGLRRWRKNIFKRSTYQEMRDFYFALRRHSYDVIFDTQGLLKTSIVMRLAKLTSTGKRVGLANATMGSGYEPLSRVFHDDSVAVDLYTHAVARARQVSACALGYDVDENIDFGLRVPTTTPPNLPTLPYVVFFHATAGASKKWPDENWVALAVMFAEKNLLVVLPWGNAKEYEAACTLAKQMSHVQILPKLSMLEAVSLANNAVLVVGVDTGLMHIAAALHRPTIALYCDSPCWKTRGDWSTNIINLGDVGMPPKLEDVSHAVVKLLDNVR